MRTALRLAAHRQQGVVLFIALIVLVAMALAGIAMVRSVDTALGIAGNLAFKQSSLQGGEQAISAAVTWLQNNNVGVGLQNNSAGNGYYADGSGAEPAWFASTTWFPSFPSLTPANGVTLNGGAPDAAGNTVRYMIHRMCNGAGTFSNLQCATYLPTSGGAAGGSMAVGSVVFQGTTQVYYRITTRIEGPRNTVSIVQVNVLLDGT